MTAPVIYGQVRDDDPGEPSTGHPRVSISALDAQVISALAHDKSVVDVGTGLGVSCRAMAGTARRVTTIDIDPWVHEHIWPDLPPNVACRSDRNGIAPAEMVFVDADHHTDAVREDLAFARTLEPKLIVVHDARASHVLDALDGEWRFIRTEYGLALQFC